MIDSGLWHTDDPEVPSQRIWLKVRETLERRTSPYQEIAVLDTVLFGRALVLNNVIQTAERDEFCYHEMLVHPVMLAHPAPRHVLIIGGGDGGALRRVLEHNTVERVTMVEIDRDVVEVCRRHLTAIHANAFDDPRVDLRFEDGFAFVQARPSRYDVIIVDGPDPIGTTPGAVLFAGEFYQALADMLTDDGIVVQQTESPFLLPAQTAATYILLRRVLPIARTYLTTVQSYDGAWSFTLGARSIDPATVDEAVLLARMNERGISACRYYSPAVHRAAFQLPVFLQQFLDESLAAGRPAETHPLMPEVNLRFPGFQP
ncbi:MAG: polyamine aminopropyltransferase [Thermorudis peleae]|nr:polyamine aminopropyltransferase [Thermorudis peleae]